MSPDRHTGKPRRAVLQWETVQPSDPCTHLYVHHPHIHPCTLRPPLHPSSGEMLALSIHPAVNACWLTQSVDILTGSWSQGPQMPTSLQTEANDEQTAAVVKAASGRSRKSPHPTKGAGETFRGG